MERTISPKILLSLLTILLFAGFASTVQAEKKKKVKAQAVVSIYDIDTLIAPIPRQRVLFHDYVAKELKRADYSDGARDHFIWIGDDTLASTVLTQAILHDAAHLDTHDREPALRRQADGKSG